MNQNILSYKIKESNYLIYSDTDYFFGDGELYTVHVKTQSIEFLRFSAESNNLESHMEFPLNKPVKFAKSINISDQEVPYLCLVTIENTFILLWFKNSEANMIESDKIRHDKMLSKDVLLINKGNKVFLNVYSDSIFVIDISGELIINEVHMKMVSPTSMFHCDNDTLFILTSETCYYFENFEELFKESYSRYIQMEKNYPILYGQGFYYKGCIYAIQTGVFKVFSIGNSDSEDILKLENEVELENVSEKLLNQCKINHVVHNNESYFSVFDGIYRVEGDKLHTVFRFGGEREITNFTIIGNFIYISSYGYPTVLYNMETQVQSRSDNDFSIVHSQFTIPHTISGLDCLVVVEGSQSRMRFIGLGLGSELQERVFEKVTNLFSFDGNIVCTSDSTTVDRSGSLNGIVKKMRTLAMSAKIQVCENKVYSIKGKELLSFESIKNAVVYDDLVAISLEGNVIELYRLDSNNVTKVHRFENTGDVSAIALDNVALCFSSWGSDSMMIFRHTGEVIRTVKLMEYSSAIRGICLRGSGVYFSTSTGDIGYAGVFSDFGPIITNVSTGFLRIHAFRDGVFASGIRTGYCAYTEESGQIEFYPCAINGSLFSVPINDETVYAVYDNYFDIISIQDSQIVLFDSFDFERRIIDYSYSNDRVVIYDGNFYFLYINTLSLVSMRFSLELNNCEVNTVEHLEFKNMSCVAIGGSEGDKNGFVAIYDALDLGTPKVKKEFKYNVTSICYYADSEVLFVASGSDILIVDVTTDKGNIILTERADPVPGSILCQKLIIEDGKLLYLDVFKSASIYQYKDNTLTLISRDFIPKELCSGCFSRYGCIVSDCDRGVYSLIQKPDSKSMITKSLFSVGEPIVGISKFRCLKLPEFVTDVFAISSLQGGVWLLIMVDETEFDKHRGSNSGRIVTDSFIEPQRCYEDLSVLEGTIESPLIDWASSCSVLLV